jgi:outer membrane protein TolC
MTTSTCSPLAKPESRHSKVLPEKITNEKVELQTLQNSPIIFEAKCELIAIEQEYHAALILFFSGGLNVGLSNSIEWTKKGYKRTGSNSYSETRHSSRHYEGNLSARMSLFSGFRNYYELRRRLIELKKAQVSYFKAVSDAICKARKAYLELIYAYQLVVLHDQIRHRKIENRNLVKLRYESGRADIGSLKRAEADVKKAEYDLEKSRRSLETHSAFLLEAMGRNDIVTILETDDKMIVDDKDIMSKPDFDYIVTETPDFLLAKYDIDSTRALSKREKSNWWPTIDFEGNINRLRYDRLFKGPVKRSWDTMLSLRYSLFGGKRLFETKRYAAEEKKVRENFRLKKNSLKAKAVSLYNALVDNYKVVEVEEFYLETYKLQAEIAKEKYMNGYLSYEDWYNVEHDYIKSQERVLNSKFNAILAKINWINFLGKVLMK